MGVKTRHMSKDNEPIDYVDEWNELPKFMTRNGPGDHEFVISPLDGKVDTSSWFVDQLTDEVGDNTGPWNYNPDVLKEGSIAQMSKGIPVGTLALVLGHISLIHLIYRSRHAERRRHQTAAIRVLRS